MESNWLKTCVGLKLKSGEIVIARVEIVLDPGNDFLPAWPLTLNWPNGISATFWKDSISGRSFYKEI